MHIWLRVLSQVPLPRTASFQPNRRRRSSRDDGCPGCRLERLDQLLLPAVNRQSPLSITDATDKRSTSRDAREILKSATIVLTCTLALIWGAAADVLAGFVTLDDPFATRGTYALGISGHDIVGSYVDNLGAHSFLYDGTSYATLFSVGQVANGISGSDIVGFSPGVSNSSFLYNGSSFSNLIDPNGSAAFGGTLAAGISGTQIVGNYANASGAHGFLYNGSTYTTLDDPNGNTWAMGISGKNVVGFYNDASGTHGFLYDGSSYTKIDDPNGTGTVHSQAIGISGNNIVGNYTDATGRHGFLFNGSTYMTIDDPNAVTGSNANGTWATGISGSDIVGYYTDAHGTHGFLYTPDIAAVPEPSSCVLFGTGALGLLAAGCVRRRRAIRVNLASNLRMCSIPAHRAGSAADSIPRSGEYYSTFVIPLA